MVNHDIVRLDISVHDAFTVAEVQRLEEFENIVSHIIVHKPRIQRPKISVIHVFENQARSLALTVPYYIQERDNIWPTGQVLEDLDFSLYFLLLDRLEDFNNAFLVVDDIDPLEYFRVFPSS
jgi:hypothetical protein